MKRLLILSCMLMAAVAARAEAPVILVFGDSISAGYGLAHVEQGWVQLLREKLKTEGYGYDVVNASVSGETTGGGLARLPRALDRQHPQIVLLELGGNDGLRVLPAAQIRANLEKMVDLAAARPASVILLGMQIPPNYGAYADQFRGVFGEVAKDRKIPLVPFLLSNVALSKDLMQDDGIHPNEQGQSRLLDTAWPQIERLLKK